LEEEKKKKIVHSLRIKGRDEGGKEKNYPFQRRARSEEKKKIVRPFQEVRERSRVRKEK
jgi:hypothetical protein